jgi:hypothetical protein
MTPVFFNKNRRDKSSSVRNAFCGPSMLTRHFVFNN